MLSEFHSQHRPVSVENGTQITLYATANTGYNFVNWTLGGNVVSTDATCNVNVAQASNYVANFESNTPTEPTTSLAGKYFLEYDKTTYLHPKRIQNVSICHLHMDCSVHMSCLLLSAISYIRCI